ncbi:MAG: Pirin domain protein [Deltaproteobacteria bacterium]|nr:Pirin domain protein [Deltaproteobacteria bacterium]
MEKTRKIRTVMKSAATIEGAGVHLRRAFGFAEVPSFDPFLLLDDFRATDPRHYLKGFPWHPHRGIETITYMVDGTVEHGDSMGNKGVIGAGDVQWMTAGSGVIHQEMPKGDGQGRMGGFQLWANLPATHKMMDPRYRDIRREQIAEISGKDGVMIRVICGKVGVTEGPVRDIVIDPILFDDGERVVLSAQEEAARFHLMSGKPIREPVAWYGPHVMNTDEELERAFDEYRNGTFIKHRQA